MEIVVVIGVMLLLVVVPVVLYLFSCSSRKRYRCPHCGEEIRTEYLNAKNCNMCGASLEEREY